MRRPITYLSLLVFASLTYLLGCGRTPAPVHEGVMFFAPHEYPQELSAWGLLTRNGDRLQLAPQVTVYDLNTPLFSDYALKLRTLYQPAGQPARFASHDAFALPVGSIISKTFFYRQSATGEIELDARWNGNPATLHTNEIKLLETRLLVKQPHGWDALPYVWQGDDAVLSLTGTVMELATTRGTPVPYVVPSRNQCAGCHAENHTTGEVRPIGLKARHLHRDDPINGENQLVAWQQRGLLLDLPALDTLSANATWRDGEQDLAHRARSYLDINCGHCHNPSGAADTSGLMLDYQPHAHGALGICKPPIAAGRGSGGLLYDIVPGQPDASILTFRMSTSDPATMMPEVGRAIVHTEGLELISAWIAGLNGKCV